MIRLKVKNVSEGLVQLMNKFNITLYSLKSTRKAIKLFNEFLLTMKSKEQQKRLQVVRDRYVREEITLYEYLKDTGGKMIEFT